MFVVIIICLNFSMFYLFYSRSKETKKKHEKKKRRKKTVKNYFNPNFLPLQN